MIYIVLFYFFSFQLGATIGSAVKCFLDRKNDMKSWITGRSYCPSCGKTLSWYELIAFFSFLGLRGKCCMCKAKIPISCFVYEGVFGIIYLLTTMLLLQI